MPMVYAFSGFVVLGINRFTHNPEIWPPVPVKSYDFPGNDEATLRLLVN